MQSVTVTQSNEIKKAQLEATVSFALENIPYADPKTMRQFLALVNTGGPFNTISHDQILLKMRQMLKYMPCTRVSSLVILMDLLGIKRSIN